VSHQRQISIPKSDTWTLEYCDKLARERRLSPTIIDALKFYDKYKDVLEDRPLGLVDMIRDLQAQVQALSAKIDNIQYVKPNEESGSQEINSDDWLSELEEME
jgi:hypothetical protein